MLPRYIFALFLQIFEGIYPDVVNPHLHGHVLVGGSPAAVEVAAYGEVEQDEEILVVWRCFRRGHIGTGGSSPVLSLEGMVYHAVYREREIFGRPVERVDVEVGDVGTLLEIVVGGMVSVCAAVLIVRRR